MKTLLALLCLAVTAPAAFAQERLFTREDYTRYFSGGAFASKSQYYASEGRVEVLSNRTSMFAGRHFLVQSMESVDVAPNYDLSSVYPFYKVISRTAEQLVWEGTRQVWVYEYSSKEFDADDSQVWESNDTVAGVSEGDRKAGDMHQFYRDADRRSGWDVAGNAAAYRESAVGFWTWQCRWLRGETYDVRCQAVHQPTGRIEDYSYRRLDQIS